MEDSTSQEIEDKDEPVVDTVDQIESAISDAQNLITFTAKSGKEVPEAILTTLISAKTKWGTDAWTPEFTVQFWEAFREINHLIKPATVASVNMISWNQKKRDLLLGSLSKTNMGEAKRLGQLPATLSGPLGS